MSANNAKMKDHAMNYVNVKEKLMHRFLYHCDSSSMQILLGLYDLEEKIHNIFPSYVSMKNLKKDILYFLRYKENRILFADSLTDAIYDDVNRFELVMYLEGYRQGYRDIAKANELEILALREFDVETMFGRKLLFHYSVPSKDIDLFRKRCIKRHLNAGAEAVIREQTSHFSQHVLKRKVFTLNHYVDRQLQMNFQSPKSLYHETNYMLTHQELSGLNRKLKKFLYRDGLRIYISAYWCGINDLVLRRYHA
ncbi:MAG: hypothetical protein SPI65_01690 [Peptoniphilus sp.]|nr:hypothetical protein [Peptoniphilus sp.]MDD7363358.1 hypothetical protein [Bacillota bacterium]MDY6044277.1 hypothetical protein [Peptoniphilus sp.]